MSTSNVIEPVTTEMGGLIVFALITDGWLCLCVDYQKLIALTIRNSYRHLRMDKCLDSLEEVKKCSTLDDKSRSFAIETDDGDRNEIVFTSNHGLYRLTRMLLRFKNVLEASQKAVGVTLNFVGWQLDLAYFDDMVVSFKSSVDYIGQARCVLRLHYEAGVTLRLK